jgi:hypothetical protein
MKLQGETLPGHEVSEYLLVLRPHSALAEQVEQIRVNFNKKFAIEYQLGAPQLAIANFFQYRMAQQRLQHHLRAVAKSLSPILVELKDFESLPTHSIFIGIATRTVLQNAIKTIRSSTQQHLLLNKQNKPHFMLEPQLPIAIKLLPWQYEKGWLEMQHQSFSGRFVADALWLLQRPLQGKGWRLVEKFALLSQQQTGVQSTLF